MLERVRCLIPAPLVLQHVVEPVLDPGQVGGVIEIGFRQRDVADKVFEDWLLLIDRLSLATIVVHVTFVGGVSEDDSRDNEEPQ